ncbi:MAG: outer membrane beta-barrel protein [Armatimonadota bacterium]|nr:outer membrane beta-barrel protein [Armatimonadota bacterium]
MRYIAAIAIVLFATCGTVYAKDDTKTPVGVAYQVFLPSNSTTKDVFGDSWNGFGLQVITPQEEDRWTPMVTLGMFQSSGDGDATLYALNVGLERGLSGSDKARPYVILKAGPYYGTVDVPSQGIDENKVGLNANATVGILFNERFYLEARYDYFSKLAGFNFNGFTLAVGVKLFDL